jgi:hypothetical protein
MSTIYLFMFKYVTNLFTLFYKNFPHNFQVTTTKLILKTEHKFWQLIKIKSVMKFLILSVWIVFAVPTFAPNAYLSILLVFNGSFLLSFDSVFYGCLQLIEQNTVEALLEPFHLYWLRLENSFLKLNSQTMNYLFEDLLDTFTFWQLWTFFNVSSSSFTMTFKVVLSLFILILIRGGVPRYRYDFLTKLGWVKFLLYVLLFFLLTVSIYFLW